MNETEKFLKRIGMPQDLRIECTEEFLQKVQYHAVTFIPYENLDILANKPLRLDAKALFEKIVERGRGGYCFELNGILSWFYKALGFTVRDYFARFLRNEEGIPMCRHRVLSVECEGKLYFCDIGIGQKAPRHPLIMEAGYVQEQFGEVYKFEKDTDLGWVLYDLHAGNWRPFISFTEEKKYEADFIQPSFYCEAHPASPFNKARILSIKTKDGRKTINDRDFKIFSGDEVIYMEENISDARMKAILKEEFHLGEEA